jgi:membrane-anchored mycosin MYCP
MTRMYRRFFSMATMGAAGLLAVTGLGLAGGPVQAAPAANSASQLTPSSNEWWFSNWQVQQKVWPLTEGSGVTVAVLDTGVQASLPDLRGVVLPGLDLTGRGTRGEVDFDYSQDGHGTAVSVLIAGQGYGTGTVGIAPEARILPVAFPPLSTVGEASSLSAQVAEAVRFAVDHGARVINMSFGETVASASSCDPVEQDAFGYALEHNVVLVASAGDTMLTGTGPIEPAACAGVLAVGGVEPDGSLWPESTQQPYVAVAAPGDHMVYVGRDGRYTTIGAGTSFSGALVSGEAALILSRYPSMPWYQVDQRIIDTALPAGHPVPNDAFGYGIVDLAKAVNASAYPVSATSPNPVYAEFKAWLASPAGQAFAARSGIASPSTGPASFTPSVPAAAAAGHARGSSPLLGRIVLVAVAVAAVGAFTVLQIMARSRRGRSRRVRSRRSRAVYDWRTLPPQYDDDESDEMPFADHDSYGPLWRYGSPQGFGRDYGPGRSSGHGPGYASGQGSGYGSDHDPGYGSSSGQGSGYGSSSGQGSGYGSGQDPRYSSGHDPGYGSSPGQGPGARFPWDAPEDAARDWKP